MESDPELRGCVAHCVHCGIRFLTHPRNAGRDDLRCPFGCRTHHRRRSSSRRSTAYYRTAGGRRKKKRLNGRRGGRVRLTDGLVAAARRPQPDLNPQVNSPPAPTSAKSPVKVELRWEGVVIDEATVRSSPMLPHVRMIVSLIEGVAFRGEEVVRLLLQAMRQHSIGSSRRTDYALGFLHQHPP